MIRAPAATQSRIADASANGEACRAKALSEGSATIMGRTSSVQSGQMAGAGESLFARRIPAMNVPWANAPESRDSPFFVLVESS